MRILLFCLLLFPLLATTCSPLYTSYSLKNAVSDGSAYYFYDRDSLVKLKVTAVHAHHSTGSSLFIVNGLVSNISGVALQIKKPLLELSSSDIDLVLESDTFFNPKSTMRNDSLIFHEYYSSGYKAKHREFIKRVRINKLSLKVVGIFSESKQLVFERYDLEPDL